MEASCLGDDPLFHAIVDHSDRQGAGRGQLPPDRSGGRRHRSRAYHYAPPLQRTSSATEAMYLMMRRVFDELGYRRYEWKCDALNAPSRTAALRLGFTFEGIFDRQRSIRAAIAILPGIP